MDPLQQITTNTLELATAARMAYNKGDIRNCKIHIGTIREYLEQMNERYKDDDFKKSSEGNKNANTS